MEAVEPEPGVPARSESSVVTSLAELRAIELQRQSDEQAAVEAAVQARRREREAAEQAVRDAEAARIAAERDAEQAARDAEAARIAAEREAEREARLRIEAIEASERARWTVALEARRATERFEVQREAVRRQRPRGLIALTALAVISAAALGGFALDRQRDAEDARAARDHAIAARQRAEQAGREAQQAVERSEHALAELRTRRAAQSDVRNGGSTGDRDRSTPARPPAPGAHRPTARPAVEPGPRPPLRISEDCLHSALCERPAAPPVRLE
jgi:colicin import membrane protein